MRILIDSGEIAAIRQALDGGFVVGATTNPTLLRRAGVRAAEVPGLARQAIDAGAEEVHLQVFAAETDRMLAEARELVAIDEARIVVKIPATPPGCSAAAQLARAGVRVTLTAVYTLRQALLAQSVGARYIAIYIGRMRDAGIDGLALAGQMQALLHAQSAGVAILAASIRDPEELVALGMHGIAAATLAPPVLGQLLDSAATAQAAATFEADARALFDEGR
jgi:transaldolase